MAGKIIKCTKCKKTFTRRYNLKMHMETAHENKVKKLVCPIKGKCNKYYSTKTKFIAHLKRFHPGKKLYNEKVAGKAVEVVFVSTGKLGLLFVKRHNAHNAKNLTHRIHPREKCNSLFVLHFFSF